MEKTQYNNDQMNERMNEWVSVLKKAPILCLIKIPFGYFTSIASVDFAANDFPLNALTVSHQVILIGQGKNSYTQIESNW